jgi:hypothetical protein
MRRQGFGHDRTDGFHDRLAGAGGRVIDAEEALEHFVERELSGRCGSLWLG